MIKDGFMSRLRRLSTREFLDLIGVSKIAPRTSAFDDPVTLESDVQQSHHVISLLKLSMAFWIIAGESATRRNVAVRRWRAAAAQGQLPAYLDLCPEDRAEVVA
jgi:hypothetical protein